MVTEQRPPCGVGVQTQERLSGYKGRCREGHLLRQCRYCGIVACSEVIKEWMTGGEGEACFMLCISCMKEKERQMALPRKQRTLKPFWIRRNLGTEKE